MTSRKEKGLNALAVSQPLILWLHRLLAPVNELEQRCKGEFGEWGTFVEVLDTLKNPPDLNRQALCCFDSCQQKPLISRCSAGGMR